MKVDLLVPERVCFVSILADTCEAFLLRNDHGSANRTIPKRFSRTLPPLADEIRVAIQRHAARDQEARRNYRFVSHDKMPTAIHPQRIFPLSTPDSILAFQFSSWYPRFKQISIKSTIVKPLEDSFQKYLDSDGVFVPDGSENG